MKSGIVPAAWGGQCGVFWFFSVDTAKNHWLARFRRRKFY